MFGQCVWHCPQQSVACVHCYLLHSSLQHIASTDQTSNLHRLMFCQRKSVLILRISDSQFQSFPDAHGTSLIPRPSPPPVFDRLRGRLGNEATWEHIKLISCFINSVILFLHTKIENCQSHISGCGQHHKLPCSLALYTMTSLGRLSILVKHNQEVMNSVCHQVKYRFLQPQNL